MGKPACPSGVPDSAGGTFQCTVAIGDATVPFIVSIAGSGPRLIAQQSWAVLNSSTAALAAGSGATCGTRRVVAAPVGSVITCNAKGRSVRLRITSLSGTLIPF